MVQFLIVKLVAGLIAELETNRPVVDAAVEVFIIDKFRLALLAGQTEFVPALLDPSIVTQSAPFNVKIEVVEEPEMTAFTPVAGLIVSVLVELEVGIPLITNGSVSV
jgi:hypothetical protein